MLNSRIRFAKIRRLYQAAIGASFLFLIGTPSNGLAQEYWVQDPTSGCSVWADEPHEGVIISWNGACEDGKLFGMGVLTATKDEEQILRFEGTMRGGKAQGFGNYDGPKGRYEGQFVDSKPHGFGEVYSNDGDYYLGQLVAGEPHGFGSDKTTAGDSYEGSYENGKHDGLGILRTADGRTLAGNFRDGELHGIGRMVFIDGSAFQGSFANGKASGIGTYFSADGVVYQGKWFAGVAHGVFLVTLEDGSQEIQHWEDDKQIQ